MLNLSSRITFTQLPTPAFPKRTKTFVFTLLHECEIHSTWQNLTDTAKVVFPKNLYFTDESNKRYTWNGQNVYGSSVTDPLLLRGDKVKMELGYTYVDNSGKQTPPQLNVLFDGFVAHVINRTPIEIHCENNMWLLKQIACPNKLYSSCNSVGDIIRDLISGTPFTVTTGTNVSDTVKVNVGDFRTINKETVAGALERLKRDAKLFSYFRGNELRVGNIVYYPQDRNEVVFAFQQNIISDSMEYKRLDDIKIGVTAYSHSKFDVTGVNKNGSTKKQKKRLEVFVGDVGGEVRTLNFFNVNNVNDLKTLALQWLPKLKYEGFYGSFTTFGQPMVRHGDAAVLRDAVIPERSGTYLIKAVTTTFGMNGFRQKVDLHMRIDTLDKSAVLAGL
jgi:hypothetical protein